MEQFNRQQGRDPELLELARRRASFKSHLFSYIVVNSFLWMLWFFSDKRQTSESGIPWPLFPLIGWGIGLFFHYIGAYVFPKNNLVDREYQKLLHEKRN